LVIQLEVCPVRSKLLAALIMAGVFSAAVGAGAQQVRPAAGGVSPPTLLSSLRWVQFSIVAGRIHGIPSQFGSTVSTRNDDVLSGRSERIAVNVTTGVPSVHYELTTKQEQVVVDVTSGDQVRIRRVPSGQSSLPGVEFSQESSGPLSLSVGDGDSRRVYRTAGLWQLMLAQPEVCREHLVPLLGLMRPDWRLAETAQEVEELLFRWAQSRKLPDVRRWAALVTQLGADSFSERQLAERSLRRAGQTVLPYLQSLDEARLSAEQRYRLRRLRDELSGGADDQAERVATWLVADPQVWVSLLGRSDETQRRIAAEHLPLLLGGPIEFDPAADAATRAAQLARLVQRLTPQPAAAAEREQRARP
jgi:hypothetical protein